MSALLQEAFEKFDRENPHVWELFKRFAFQAIAAGHKDLSASLIVERIRWETTVVTTDTEFKVNNNHRAYYARKFNEAFPFAGGKFVTRVTESEKSAA